MNICGGKLHPEDGIVPIGAGLDMCGINKHSLWVHILQLHRFQQDMGKYLFENIGALKPTGIVFPKGRKMRDWLDPTAPSERSFQTPGRCPR